MFIYKNLTKIDKENVRGGVGKICSRDYLQQCPVGMQFSAFGLNEMQPGATIPEHCHADSAEFYFIVSGQGTGIHNGKTFKVEPGDGWLCQTGETHGILNNLVDSQTLSFVSVFFK